MSNPETVTRRRRRARRSAAAVVAQYIHELSSKPAVIKAASQARVIAIGAARPSAPS